MKIKQIDFDEALDLIRNNIVVYAISISAKTKALVKFENIPIKKVGDYIYFVCEEAENE